MSVTQAFNTTTSMGRLTLNVLLSFAQFEREVTGERIRDKIAASKKKGMWMGGQPALGYDVKDRKLVVNEAEAETVRTIFRRYLELGSVRALKATLDCRRRRQQASHGRRRQRLWRPSRFSRGALYLMLQNRIYRGEIVHKGAAYPGEHAAIVDEDLWRAGPGEARSQRRRAARRRDESKLAYLLTGILFDAEGQPMTPTHAVKKGVRYRYYVSRRLITDIKANSARETDCREQGQRLPAGDLERSDGRTSQVFLRRSRRRRGLSAKAPLAARLTSNARSAQPRRSSGPSRRRRGKTFELLRPLIVAAQVHPDRIDIELAADQVTDALLDGEGSIGDRLGRRISQSPRMTIDASS